MARGFGGGYTYGAATGSLRGDNLGTGAAGGGAGGVRRDAEVTAAQRAVSGGSDANQAVARVQNAGGGELKLTSEQLSNVLRLRDNGLSVAGNGAIMVDMSKLGTSDLLKGEIKMFDSKGKEMKMERTVTVQIVENGISGYRMGTKAGTFTPARGKAEITEEQRQAILGANMPLQMRGAVFNKSGQINGWKISPEIFPDKATRAALYKHMNRDGTLRFSPDSPVAKSLADIRGGGGVDPRRLNDLVKG
jgi:hypothetical protein